MRFIWVLRRVAVITLTDSWVICIVDRLVVALGSMFKTEKVRVNPRKAIMRFLPFVKPKERQCDDCVHDKHCYNNAPNHATKNLYFDISV